MAAGISPATLFCVVNSTPKSMVAFSLWNIMWVWRFMDGYFLDGFSSKG
jgi:hypothetical protein